FHTDDKVPRRVGGARGLTDDESFCGLLDYAAVAPRAHRERQVIERGTPRGFGRTAYCQHGRGNFPGFPAVEEDCSKTRRCDGLAISTRRRRVEDPDGLGA
ncbi:hypothetical protein V8D89_009982, partial [Ganoderma adspersum]